MRPDQDQQATALEAEISDADRALLDRLADGIVRRRLGAVALFMAESVHPLGFASSQVMQFLRPVIGALWTKTGVYDQIARLLERRGALELLCRRLEARL